MSLKIFMKPVFLFLLVFLTFGCSYTHKGYYLSPSGNDDNTGSFSKPWKSLERLNKADIKPGRKVFLQGGGIFKGSLLLDSLDHGYYGREIIIASYGQGRAVIDGGDNEGIIARGTSFFQIKNIIVRGNGRKEGNISDGILLTESDDFILDSIEVYGFQHSGVKINGSSNARITNVYAHDNGFAGIHVTSGVVNLPVDYGNENLYIGYCVAENNPGDPTVMNNHSGNGILASSVKDGLIEYCEAFNNGWDMPWKGNGPVGIWIWDCTGITIQHCISHDNKTNPVAKDGGGFDLDGGVSNSVIQYCLSYYNQGAGFGLFEFGASKPWENNILRFNISWNDGIVNEGSLAVWKEESSGSMKGCEIYNNTFWNDTTGGISVSMITNVPGIRFNNNLFAFRGSFLGELQRLDIESLCNNCFLDFNLDSLDSAIFKGDSNFIATGDLYACLKSLLDSAKLKLPVPR